jgi:DNA-binding CsgD family transcriptional regulator
VSPTKREIRSLQAKAAPLLDRIVAMSAAAHDLSPRETQVLHLLLEGDEYIQIAAALGIAERTVKMHTNNIFRKFGVHRREALFTAMFWRK